MNGGRAFDPDFHTIAVSYEDAPKFTGAFLRSETVTHEGVEFLVYSLVDNMHERSFTIRLARIPA